MSSVIRIAVTASLLAAGLVSLSCERAEPLRSSTPSKAAPADSAADSSSTAAHAGWRVEGGPFLAIPDDSMASAMIVAGAEDSASGTGSGITDTLTIDVFSTGGKTGTAVLVPSRPSHDTEQCLAWPTARVRRVGRSGPAPRWNVGWLSGRALPSAMDSLGGLSKADSAQLVADIARLASTAPNDTALMFRGLPFRVQTAYLLHASDTETALIATVIRNINQEANARAEHLLLIAARPNNQRRSPYTLRYFERSSGAEESIESTDILGTVLLGAERRAIVVIGRSDDSGVAFSLLERDDRGKWTLLWSSPFRDC